MHGHMILFLVALLDLYVDDISYFLVGLCHILPDDFGMLPEIPLPTGDQ